MPEESNKIQQFLVNLGVKLPFEELVGKAFDLNAKYRETMHPKWRYIIDGVFTQMFLQGFLSLQDLAQGAGVSPPLPEDWLKNLLDGAGKASE